MNAEVIAREQRFTLYSLQHRGITDTKGKKADCPIETATTPSSYYPL
ncbi:MAG TPA: hypothetical protein VGN07_12010 [Steroidobacteraceae bacterium]|jgi:hypothetical protein